MRGKQNLRALFGLLQLQAAEMGETPRFGEVRRRHRLYPLEQRQRRREIPPAHEQQSGVVHRVRIARLDRNGPSVARKRLLFPSGLFLQYAEIVPCVRQIGTAREGLAIGELRLARTLKLVQYIAEIERNHGVRRIEASGESVPPLG